MYRRSSTAPTVDTRRRGVILLVVITLLTLFAAVGLTFVIYAEAEATASRIFREAQEITSTTFTGDPADFVSNFALGRLIYDEPDDADGVQSSLRGHSLARAMYGYNSQGLNQTPYNGTGRQHRTLSTGVFNGQDDYSLIHYMYFSADGGLRDPERDGVRPAPTAAVGPFTGGANAPYTYPDLNNMYLAGVNQSGIVLTPSFHRPALFGSVAAANPNWTNANGKYLLLRPRPADMGPGFPMPLAGGDVKNLKNLTGGNDSYWIDLGYPVRTLADGRKYKALFAYLVTDLDSLVNVNVHGNLKDPSTHRSNQGWGRWEVNPAYVLDANATEWMQMLLGNGTLDGRYGPNRLPGAASGNALGFDSMPMYAAGDYDGNAMTPPALPNPGRPFTSFPAFLPAGAWLNGGKTSSEVLDHPSRFNLFRYGGTINDDRVFAVDEMRHLLNHQPTVTTLAQSVLAQLCPQNLDNGTATTRQRRQITTHSFDLDVPGVTPWIWNPNSTTATERFRLMPTPLYPSGSALPHPSNQTTPVAYGTVPPDGSEFAKTPDGLSGDWRAVSAGLGKVDLNRPLRPYPAVNLTATPPISDTASFNNAQQDRKDLARDVFQRLRAATGATDPTNATYGPGTPEYDANRWLAQLAVNIVDYIDGDDYITPFNWNPAAVASEADGWVFGTELGRLVINEFYIDYINDPTDDSVNNPPMGMPANKKATKPYHVRVWVELHNPLPGIVSPTDDGRARLQYGLKGQPTAPYAAYQLLVTKTNPDLRKGNNVRGDYDAAADQVLATLNDWQTQGPAPLIDLTSPPVVDPAAQSTTGGSFIVIGPDAIPLDAGAGTVTLALQTPPLTATPPTPSTSLSYPSPLTDAMGNAIEPDPPTLLLQRLACPHLPPQADPALPLYNPYITVDYVDTVDGTGSGNPKLQINRAIEATQTAAVPASPDNGNMVGTAMLASKRKAWGRPQPFGGHTSLRKQQAPNPANTNEPQHTLGRANGTTNPPVAGDTTLHMPFDWLVFRDRPLVNPLELLDVPAFKPHELTQQFLIDGNTDGTLAPTEKFLHRAPWTVPDARIYRALEWFSARDLAPGLRQGDRVAGRMNINTMWDARLLQALCDRSPSNQFTAADVTALWTKLYSAAGTRTPMGANLPFNTLDHQPFTSLAAALTGTGSPDGLEKTVFRTNTFQVATPTHPLLQNELLTKIYGNLTVRSNVFAVWVTVGYFLVTDETTIPVKLGSELNAGTGREVRQRFFSIVDRTGLNLFNADPNKPPDEMTTCGPVALTADSAGNWLPQTLTVPIPAIDSNPVGQWQIRQGTLLRLDIGADQEVITVMSVDTNVSPPAITAHFTRPHPGPNVRVAILGNPGPQPAFDWRHPKYAPVVLYFTQLD